MGCHNNDTRIYSNISIVCQTSGGCTFGGSGLGSGNQRNRPPPGVEAADLILKPLVNGSCVDDHIQDQVRTLPIVNLVC